MHILCVHAPQQLVELGGLAANSMSSLELQHKTSAQGVRHTGMSGGVFSGLSTDSATGQVLYVKNAASRAHEVAQTMRSSLRQVLFTHVLPCPAAREWAMQMAITTADSAAVAASIASGSGENEATAAGTAAAERMQQQLDVFARAPADAVAKAVSKVQAQRHRSEAGRQKRSREREESGSAAAALQLISVTEGFVAPACTMPASKRLAAAAPAAAPAEASATPAATAPHAAAASAAVVAAPEAPAAATLVVAGAGVARGNVFAVVEPTRADNKKRGRGSKAAASTTQETRAAKDKNTGSRQRGPRSTSGVTSGVGCKMVITKGRKASVAAASVSQQRKQQAGGQQMQATKDAFEAQVWGE